ncbi:MAG: glucosaminidase domain-containing protein [Deltaproteobacteria bacterium]|nr:glucosaminidase domain-containing protein [Deltaproteobacteria bacterium]
MRVGPNHMAGSTQEAARVAPSGGSRAHGREVKLERTPATRSELRAAIRRAFVRSEGAEPPEKLVEVLTAHACLETASGDRMYNFNFAGIKGYSPAGMTAVARTREVLGGKDVEIRDGFRAYATIDEGARDYVNVMKGRFAGALGPAARGDVAGFAHALKSAGYYTAAESDYAKGLAGLMGSSAAGFAREHTSGAAAVAAKGYVPHGGELAGARSAPGGAVGDLGALSAQGLARVEGALDLGRWMDALGASPTHARRAADDDEDS